MTDEAVSGLFDRSRECLEAAADNAAARRWNRAVSDLYYAVFDACRAVLLTMGVEARTHSHVRSQVHVLLVRPGLLTRDEGRLYGLLFELRLQGDYSPDQPLQERDVLFLMKPVPSLVARLQVLAGGASHGQVPPAPADQSPR